MAEQLNKFMTKVEELPPTIRKTSEEIHNLDQKVHTIMKEIKIKTLAQVKNHRKLTRDQKTKMFKEVQELYKKAEAMSDQKAKMASQMYDLVDENIRTMDKNTAAFNEYYKKKYSQENQKLDNLDSPERKRKQAAPQKGDKKKKGNDHRTARINETGALMDSFKPMQIQRQMDMPVDPSEPRYCVCHQVSFGEMVACDNKDCKYEWFHFQCVGLTESPTGLWFCEHCRDSQKKRK